MTKTIAFIGIGHLAEYMIRGLQKAESSETILLVPRSCARAEKLVAEYPNLQIMRSAQTAINAADIVIIATRPVDVVTVLEPLTLRADQTVISVAAGVDVATLQMLTKPALAVRSLPLSCVAIHKSPTLIYPRNSVASAFFGRLGQVYTLASEIEFPASSALTGALYAWMFALMQEASDWAVAANLPADLARELVQDSFEGAAAMAREQADKSLDVIWDSLATPGGISARGHKVIKEMGGFNAFTSALELVEKRLHNSQSSNLVNHKGEG